MPAFPVPPNPSRPIYIAPRLFGEPDLRAQLHLNVRADDGHVDAGAAITSLRNDELCALWAHCSYPIDRLPLMASQLIAEVLLALEVLR